VSPRPKLVRVRVLPGCLVYGDRCEGPEGEETGERDVLHPGAETSVPVEEAEALVEQGVAERA
jgi:hypothetical protein